MIKLVARYNNRYTMMATLEMEPGAEWAWLWAWLCPWCSTSCWEMITVSLEQHRRE